MIFLGITLLMLGYVSLSFCIIRTRNETAGVKYATIEAAIKEWESSDSTIVKVEDGDFGWFNRLERSDIVTIFDYLKRKNNPPSVFIEIYQANDNIAEAVTEYSVYPNNNVRSVLLGGNGVSNRAVDLIANVLKSPFNQLASLKLIRSRHISNAIPIVDALSHKNCKVHHIDLSDTNIGDEFAIALGPKLDSVLNFSPEDTLYTENSLLLENTQLTLKGLCALVDGMILPGNSLNRLELSGNAIGWEGGRLIANMLRHPNNRLYDFTFSWHSIGGDGVDIIAESLCNENCFISSMQLHYPSTKVPENLENVIEKVESCGYLYNTGHSGLTLYNQRYAEKRYQREQEDARRKLIENSSSSRMKMTWFRYLKGLLFSA